MVNTNNNSLIRESRINNLFVKNTHKDGNCFVNTTLPNGTYLVRITKSSSQESVISKLTINNN